MEDYYKDFTKNDFSEIEDLFSKYKSSNPFLILDLEIWKKKLYDFYLYDKERLKNRKIIALEKNFECEFEGIKLRGVIDRIDKYEDIYEVIDYSFFKNEQVSIQLNIKDIEGNFLPDVYGFIKGYDELGIYIDHMKIPLEQIRHIVILETTKWYQ